MECVVDYREIGILKHFPDVSKENLEIGDMQLRYNGETRIIIERKTINDLAQSVKDNRYKEQKARLLAFRKEHPGVQIVYVLEGYYMFDPVMMYSGLSNNVIHGCIINTMLRDGIFTAFTKNITDTCHFIGALMKRFEKEPDVYLRREQVTQNADNVQEDEEQRRADYVNTIVHSVKTKKKENIDEYVCFIMQLSCIPGISAKKAQDMIAHLDVTNMVDFSRIVEARGVQALVEIPGIGKILAKSIVKHMMGKTI